MKWEPRGAHWNMRVGACTSKLRRAIYHGEPPKFGKQRYDFWKLNCVDDFVRQGTYTFNEIDQFGEEYAAMKGKPGPDESIEDVALGFRKYLAERARTKERWRYGSAKNGPGYVGPGSGPRTLRVAIRGAEWDIEQLRRKEAREKAERERSSKEA